MNPSVRKRFSCVIGLVALITAGAALAAEEITAESWGEKTGFKPDLTLMKVPPGTFIDKTNYKEVEGLLAPGMKLLIEKYNFSFKTREYAHVHPSLGYIEATNQHRGKAKIIDVGKEYRKLGLAGYGAGMPFPAPQTGLEVGWNFQYSYIGDDGDLNYDVIWVSATKGIEHTEKWRWAFILRTLNRTGLDPKPELPGFREKGVQTISMTYALAPFDKLGFGALYVKTIEPLDIQGHIYVPAMRRVLRNTFGTRGDTWNATDLLYEDVRGFSGYPEWMSYRILEKKTLLMAVHSGVKFGKGSTESNFDLKNWPRWNPRAEFEPRPTYVVEVIPKLPDYPYRKMIMYFDAETGLINFKETFDRKGQQWKVLLTCWGASPDMNKMPPDYGPSLVVDVQSEHATAINFTRSRNNSNLDPDLFTLSELRKRGN